MSDLENGGASEEPKVDLQELLNKSNDIIAENEKRLADLEIEKQSLLEELTGLKENLEKTTAELAETKKLNFTLGRTLGIGQKSVEEMTQDSYKEAFANIR